MSYRISNFFSFLEIVSNHELAQRKSIQIDQIFTVYKNIDVITNIAFQFKSCHHSKYLIFNVI